MNLLLATSSIFLSFGLIGYCTKNTVKFIDSISVFSSAAITLIEKHWLGYGDLYILISLKVP